MSPEEQQQQREAQRKKIAEAWMRLSQNDDFLLIYEQDLQRHFGLFKSSFSSEDGFNPHAAAQKDGQKQVLLYIHRRRLGGQAMLDADDETPAEPKESVSEYQGTPP